MDGTSRFSPRAAPFDPSIIFVYVGYILAVLMGIGGVLALTPWFPFK